MIWSTTKDCARTDHGIATLAGFSPSSQGKPCFNMVFLTSLALRLSSNRRSGITGFVIGGGWQIQKERQGRTRVLLLCCCNVIPPLLSKIPTNNTQCFAYRHLFDDTLSFSLFMRRHVLSFQDPKRARDVSKKVFATRRQLFELPKRVERKAQRLKERRNSV